MLDRLRDTLGVEAVHLQEVSEYPLEVSDVHEADALGDSGINLDDEVEAPDDLWHHELV